MTVHRIRTHPRALERIAAASASLLLSLISACSSSTAEPDVASPDTATSETAMSDTATTDAASTGSAWPRSMVVLGHSGVNGEGTPGNPADNSWAGGSSPEVDSVYLRILKHEPAIQDQVTNLAQSGATVADVGGQADTALALDPAPDLVVVQVVDNDMACPATEADVDLFRDDLTALLARLSDGMPDARIFIPTFYAEPASYIQSLNPEQRVTVGGEGPCAIVTTDGTPNRTELRRLEAIVEEYDAAIMAACEATDRCWHDGGAFERTRLRRGEIGDDLSHLSIAGNAHAAAVAWRAMRAAGVLPPS